VVVQKVEQKTVPLTVSAIGNVEAYSTVAIKAQVAGELLELHFKEGDFVRKGQLLLTIDPRPYQTALAQAQANLARDKAIAANNRVQADRYKKLFAEGVVPAQDVDTYSATADASDATVQADQAAVKTAELNLSYCSIYSPIDGRTGAVMVKPGNLIKVSDVPIVVINQVNPIYVDFTVPQQYLPEVKKYMALQPLRVQVTVPSDTGPFHRNYSSEGELCQFPESSLAGLVRQHRAAAFRAGQCHRGSDASHFHQPAGGICLRGGFEQHGRNAAGGHQPGGGRRHDHRKGAAARRDRRHRRADAAGARGQGPDQEQSKRRGSAGQSGRSGRALST
jgi:biotin carboxyl carrier protein